MGVLRVAEAWGQIVIDGLVHDGVPLDLGPARVLEPPCANYEPAPAGCPGGCPAGSACGYDGACVPRVSPLMGARVSVTVGEQQRTFTADAVTGRIEGVWDAEVGAEPFSLRLRVPGEAIVTFSAGMPGGFADWVQAYDPNGNGGSGPVVFTWDPVNDGSQMHLHLNPNHHAPYGFSECIVPEADGTLTAHADIVEPLRRVTGFEGGTATRRWVGSVELPAGCVELSVGVSTLIAPNG